MGLLNSEWIKLRSTKSPYWLYGLGIAFVVGLGAIFGKVDTTVTIDGAGTMGFITVFAMFAVGVFLQSFVWVMAIIAVTGEYRYGTNKTTFLAAPRRWDAFLAKSVVTALVTTGGVITSAGIVLAATFGVLWVIPLLFMAQIGFIVAFGVLLDTFVVRSLLVPALAVDLGARTWWPGRLARRPDPAPQEAAQ